MQQLTTPVKKPVFAESVTDYSYILYRYTVYVVCILQILNTGLVQDVLVGFPKKNRRAVAVSFHTVFLLFKIFRKSCK